MEGVPAKFINFWIEFLRCAGSLNPWATKFTSTSEASNGMEFLGLNGALQRRRFPPGASRAVRPRELSGLKAAYIFHRSLWLSSDPEKKKKNLVTLLPCTPAMPSQKKGPKPAKGFKPKKNTKPAHPGRKNKKKDKSTKIPNKVITPVSHEEEDPEISDEDLEFFEEHDEYSNFLTSLDTTALSKNEIINAKRPSSKLTKDGFAVPEPTALSPSDDEDGAWSDASDEDAKAGFGGSDEEQEYELKARKVASDWTRRDTFTKLPIKLANGRVMQQPETEVMEEDSDSGAGALEEENADGQEENEAIREERDEMMFVPTAAGGLDDAKPISKKAYLLGKKELLADIAQKIIENPEGNIGQLKRLRKISQDENQKVRQLAFLTQLAVYKDIIPGYRIRALSDKERTAQVSKDVKMLRNFEQALLVNYQNYLQDLENESRILPLKPKSDEVPAEEPAQRDEAVALVAVRCMCDLLTSVTHFNFRTNLMTAIVSRMSTVKWTEVTTSLVARNIKRNLLAR
ncbi:hypothetical protein BC936DRAFT_148636 [Jimgerdemannia flammicorona]|uniref:Nucleolar complex-associated protein 3 N-terminal domain-containing protein n=1 Tax=Jimgerdemannia flammicorona TaxID=994334 RepID=A0A433DKF2_9FUNG|nr:hypothetical protein BC936DRAFT_148636 [Jimgerdemannia flammicorona]